jgi:hypothetical protein
VLRLAGSDKPKQEVLKSSAAAEQGRRRAMVVLLSAARERAEQERPREMVVVVMELGTRPGVGGRAEDATSCRCRRRGLLPDAVGGSFAGA